MNLATALSLVLDNIDNFKLLPLNLKQDDLIVEYMVGKKPEFIRLFTSDIKFSRILIKTSGNNLMYLSDVHRKILEPEAIENYPNLYFKLEERSSKDMCLKVAVMRNLEGFGYKRLTDKDDIIYLCSRNITAFKFFEKKINLPKDLFFSKNLKPLREIFLDIKFKYK